MKPSIIHTLRLIGFSLALSGLAIYVAPAYAADSTALTRLADGNACENCDLTGADLSGSNLSYASLNSVILNKATLTNVDFSYADLTDANLNGADLTGGKMDRTNLTGAELIGATLDTDVLKDATVCRTIMPNDEINMRDCEGENPFEKTNSIEP